MTSYKQWGSDVEVMKSLRSTLREKKAEPTGHVVRQAMPIHFLPTPLQPSHTIVCAKDSKESESSPIVSFEAR